MASRGRVTDLSARRGAIIKRHPDVSYRAMVRTADQFGQPAPELRSLGHDA